MKINIEDGVRYVYDPETRTFGAYNFEGKTITFHMAGSNYFWNQPGFSVWGY